tara:strand:- start:237084 stop:237260 length:177 start_codon:yes stop_codon:yes gene_type:complete
MSEKENKSSNYGLYLGIAGFIAGIILSFSENWIIGVSGALASAGVAYTSYKAKGGGKV